MGDNTVATSGKFEIIYVITGSIRSVEISPALCVFAVAIVIIG